MTGGSIRNGEVKGRPLVNYKDTKANIEALSGVPEGASAYATDTNQLGSYDGATWTWGSGGTLASDGWKPISATWTRTGNHTFTVSGDQTSNDDYKIGKKIRYKDGGSYEYGVIKSRSYSAPNTTITLITNNDFAMASATITDTYISMVEEPDGFPAYFNYTPAWTSDGTQPAIGNGTIKGIYSTIGRRIKTKGYWHTLAGGTSTYGTSTYRFSMPATENGDIDSLMYSVGNSAILDISAVTYYEGICQVNMGTVIIIVGSTIVQAASPITFADGDYIWWDVEYWF